MQKILVTGANGYIGTHVVKYLVQNTSHKIIAVDLSSTHVPSQADFVQEDILAQSQDDNLFAQIGSPDILLHLAWQDGFKHNAPSHLENLPKHFSFIKNMIEHGIRNIAVMGSMHEVGYYEGEISDINPPATHPMSYYAIAKNSLRQALFVLVNNYPDLVLKWLRGFYITGDDVRSNSIFSKIIQWEKEGKRSFPFTDGTAKYDFTDIHELAKMIAIAGIFLPQRKGGRKEIINVCSGVAVPLKDKVEQFLKEKHLQIRPEYGAFSTRPYDSPCCYGNNTKISSILRQFHSCSEDTIL